MEWIDECWFSPRGEGKQRQSSRWDRVAALGIAPANAAGRILSVVLERHDLASVQPGTKNSGQPGGETAQSLGGNGPLVCSSCASSLVRSTIPQCGRYQGDGAGVKPKSKPGGTFA